MFESILRNYPRRTDIWSTHIDQEIKGGDADRIRALLERATHLELNPKSMKFLFKQYLDYERAQGDRKRVEHVKQRAMEYVANKFGGDVLNARARRERGRGIRRREEAREVRNHSVD